MHEIRRMVVLGGAGDLSKRLLLPALADLEARGALPGGFTLTGAGRTTMDDVAYQAEVREALSEHAGHVSTSAREALVARCRHRSVDASDAAALQEVVTEGEGPVLVYLALPPDLLADAAATIGAVTLPVGSRVAVEKPVGHDLASATRIEAVLARFDPGVVLRTDHFVALPTVRDFVLRRVHDVHLDRSLDREHVARVEIAWDESLGLEGRAGYYDAAGALRDMLQSHLVQLMAIVAMDRPVCADDAFVRREKLELLSAVRLPSPEDAASAVVRARYEAGEIDGRAFPSYVDEDGVDPHHDTETFVELTLHVDNRRWRGVPFVLRSGKALGDERKEIRIVFRRGLQEGFTDVHGVVDHVLSIPIEDAEPGDPDLPAYAEVVRSALAGDADYSVSGAEVLASWAIVEPYLQAFARGDVPLLGYEAGSDGPDARRPSATRPKRAPPTRAPR